MIELEIRRACIVFVHTKSVKFLLSLWSTKFINIVHAHPVSLGVIVSSEFELHFSYFSVE